MRGEKQFFLTGDETDCTVILKATLSRVNDCYGPGSRVSSLDQEADRQLGFEQPLKDFIFL